MNAQDNSGAPDLSEAINKIMAHPELISMVASVLGKPQQVNTTPEDQLKEEISQAPADAPPPDVLAAVMPMISKLSSIGAKGDSSPSGLGHEQLLYALKPYISHSRSEAIDYIIKFSKMSSLLQGLK